MQIETSLQTVSAVVGRHLFDGKATNIRRYRWAVDVSGRCTAPYTHELTGRGDPVLPSQAGKTLFVDMAVRCRRCGWCLRQRANDWAARARREMSRPGRSWFITLTLSPQSHYALASRGRDFSLLGRHRQISQEITKYFKRIRKTGAKFRYVIVMEPHKGERNGGNIGSNRGLPHYHLLVHEHVLHPLQMEKTPFIHPKSGRVTQQWRGVFHAKWPWGFVDAQLTTEMTTKRKEAVTDVAWYVCKYLAKDAAARVRASLHYGAEPEAPPACRPHDIAVSGAPVQAELVERSMDRVIEFFKRVHPERATTPHPPLKESQKTIGFQLAAKPQCQGDGVRTMKEQLWDPIPLHTEALQDSTQIPWEAFKPKDNSYH